MLIGNLPEDTTISENGFLLYSEDGVHAVKIRKKNAFTSGVQVFYGLTAPEDQIGLTPKDGDIYFKLNGASLADATIITRIYVYVESGSTNRWVPSSFAAAGDVIWQQIYDATGAEHIANIIIDGSTIPVNAPAGGTMIGISNLQSQGTTVAIITLDGTDNYIRVPNDSSSYVVENVIARYNSGGQVVETSIVDDGVAKINLDPDTLTYNTNNGICVNLKMLDDSATFSNPDFADDNTASNSFTIPSSGNWQVFASVKLEINSTYSSIDPDEYLYLKLVGNCIDDGSIEERVPIALYNGETLSTQTISLGGMITASANDTLTAHFGGNLANSLSVNSLTVYFRAVKLGG